MSAPERRAILSAALGGHLRSTLSGRRCSLDCLLNGLTNLDLGITATLKKLIEFVRQLRRGRAGVAVPGDALFCVRAGCRRPRGGRAHRPPSWLVRSCVRRPARAGRSRGPAACLFSRSREASYVREKQVDTKMSLARGTASGPRPSGASGSRPCGPAASLEPGTPPRSAPRRGASQTRSTRARRLSPP